MAKKVKDPSSVNPMHRQEFEKSFRDATERYMPGVSVNIVVFNYRNGKLKILDHASCRYTILYVTGWLCYEG